MTDEADFLATYRAADHPPFAVTTDLALFAVTQGELFLMARRRAQHPFSGRLALPGGFLKPEESAEAAAERIAGQRTGLRARVALEQLATFSAPDRDPRMRIVSIGYVGVAATADGTLPELEVADGQWAPFDGLSAKEMAFDHHAIATTARERLAGRMEYTLAAAAFLPPTFTMSQLRSVYAAVWGYDLDPGNFTRKIRAAKVLEATSERYLSPGGRGAPAQVFRIRGGLSTDPLAPSLLYPPIRRDWAGPAG